ncbi:hypothetical protein AX17_007495 [Amanita inopinata Kibby_2008]|nr:hypothetical protein AX17_007495 [Amanita inopinata Kibby_2008]
MRFSAFSASLLAATAIRAVSGATVHHATARQQAATTACNEILKKLGSTIVVSSGAEYNSSIHATWNFINDGAPATCVVLPRHTSDVQVAMKAIYHARAHYAVQAGHHSANKDWNVVADGVLILFTYMSEVSYNPATDTITMQPNPTWEQAANDVGDYGVAPIGGRVRDVGSGLLLGGGISYLSTEYGFASDMFKELDVVLVTGEMVTVNAHNKYSDLFWALKACANRCGIVTRYELYPARTGPAGTKPYYGGFIRYPQSSSAAVVKAIGEFNGDGSDTKATILNLFYHNTFPDGTSEEHADLFLFYKGTELPKSIFGDFLSIPSLFQRLSPLNYSEVITTFPRAPHGNVQFFGASAQNRDVPLLQSTYDSWQNFSRTFSSEVKTSFLAYTPILNPMILASRARGGNPINPPLGGFITINFGLTLPDGVTTAADDLEAGRQLLFQQAPPSPGLPLYIGESDVKQNSYATYTDYTRLKEVYMKYDPTRFNMEHTDGPFGL